MAKSNFNDFRFEGLKHSRYNSSKMFVSQRVSEDQKHIAVRFADCHVFETRYGFGLRLDRTHVVFIKGWAVSRAEYGNGYEVLLNVDYFNVKEWGENDEFDDNGELCEWSKLVEVAQAQQEAGTECIFRV